MQMMVKGVLAGFWLIFVPTAAGIPCVKKKKDYALGESFLAGLLLMLAVAQLLILPGIFRKLSLHLVTLLFAAVMGLCAAYGLYRFAGSAGSYGKRLRKSIPEISPWMWIAAGVILVQIGVCVYYAHLDADDAFYVATAALLALGCQLCRTCQSGRCNWGIATQRPELVARLDPEAGSRRLLTLMNAWNN